MQNTGQRKKKVGKRVWSKAWVKIERAGINHVKNL